MSYMFSLTVDHLKLLEWGHAKVNARIVVEYLIVEKRSPARGVLRWAEVHQLVDTAWGPLKKQLAVFAKFIGRPFAE